MKEYVGNMKEYIENMKKYVGIPWRNMWEYEGICGNMKKYLEKFRALPEALGLEKFRTLFLYMGLGTWNNFGLFFLQIQPVAEAPSEARFEVSTLLTVSFI